MGQFQIATTCAPAMFGSNLHLFVFSSWPPLFAQFVYWSWSYGRQTLQRLHSEPQPLESLALEHLHVSCLLLPSNVVALGKRQQAVPRKASARTAVGGPTAKSAEAKAFPRTVVSKPSAKNAEAKAFVRTVVSDPSAKSAAAKASARTVVSEASATSAESKVSARMVVSEPGANSAEI